MHITIGKNAIQLHMLFFHDANTRWCQLQGYIKVQKGLNWHPTIRETHLLTVMMGKHIILANIWLYITYQSSQNLKHRHEGLVVP